MVFRGVGPIDTFVSIELWGITNGITNGTIYQAGMYVTKWRRTIFRSNYMKQRLVILEENIIFSCGRYCTSFLPIHKNNDEDCL